MNMQWLLTLETEDDPIPTCRLLNTFRRKSIKIVNLTLAAVPSGYSMLALVETPESEVTHVFNYLRRVEGVRHVTCYRHQTSANATFVFMDAGADASRTARLMADIPGSKLVFAGQGKVLLEVPATNSGDDSAFTGQGCMPFARVLTSREVASQELVAAPAS